MNNPVFEHSDTLLFALLACTILYINGTQFRYSVFTFVQYIKTNGHVLSFFNKPGFRIKSPFVLRTLKVFRITPEFRILSLASVSLELLYTE